jgi:hypothetical protein
MSANPNSLTMYNPQSANGIRDNNPASIVINEASNDVELAKVLIKFETDIIATVKVEKESGRLGEDGRVRTNIRERIGHIVQNAALQLSTESRTGLLNSFGLKLLAADEFILAQECFENSLILADSVPDTVR